jgi:NADPH:quinone reductase-like Zn-dependent oxidoreductase
VSVEEAEMRAFQLKDHIGPAGLELVELPAPEPARDAVLVDVRAIGANSPDLLMTKGQYQYHPDLPTVPGCEVAVVGVASGAFLGLDPALMGEQARSLDRMVADGVVRPHIDARFDFERIPEALAQLQRGEIPGKGVVV